MALAKSAKIIPVALVSALTGVIKLKPQQIVITITITAGLIIFNWNKVGKIGSESTFGISLVMISLIFDGISSSK